MNHWIRRRASLLQDICSRVASKWEFLKICTRPLPNAAVWLKLGYTTSQYNNINRWIYDVSLFSMVSNTVFLSGLNDLKNSVLCLSFGCRSAGWVWRRVQTATPVGSFSHRGHLQEAPTASSFTRLVRLCVMHGYNRLAAYWRTRGTSSMVMHFCIRIRTLCFHQCNLLIWASYSRILLKTFFSDSQH